MTNGIGTVTAAIAILGALGLLALAGSTILNQTENSLLGNETNEGLINETDNFSYGDEDIKLSSWNLRESELGDTKIWG